MAWVHYIPVKEDLSDLHEMYEWAEKHVKKSREIAKAGTDFVRRIGRPEGMDQLYRRHYLRHLENTLEAYQPSGGKLALADSDLVLQEVMRCGSNAILNCRLRGKKKPGVNKKQAQISKVDPVQKTGID